MTKVEQSIDIRAPVDMVFAQITDPRRAPEWDPRILEVHGISGPIGPGAVWHQTISVLGRSIKLTCRVLRYEPPTYGEVEVSGDQEGHVWTRCEQRTGTTRVTQGIQFGSTGSKLREVAGFAAQGMIKREMRAAMARQRNTLEREAESTA